MAERKLYKDYFNIKPKYYATVTKDLIEKGEVTWQSFYPHESFIKLLESVHKALSDGNASVWLEGAYGTGKSHAALVVKSLLEASDDEVKAYFEDFKLSKDLYQKLTTDKRGEGGKTLLVVHRISSSDINYDTDLVSAVQVSIENALKKAGIENKAGASLKGAALKWFKAQELNRNYFNGLIEKHSEKHPLDFEGLSGDEVFKLLEESDDPDKVFSIMQGVLKIAKKAGITAIQLDAEGLCDWIVDVIQKNNLSSILFIWDEFTEFFQKNPNSLTGFQTLVELGTSEPFHFLIVTHESSSLIRDSDTRGKIMDRFIGKKSVRIEIPENISFRLMAQAMKETDDPVLKNEWHGLKSGLNAHLSDVRTWLIKKANKNVTMGSKNVIKDDDLCNIVPIHPYAALLLKHISVAYQSNARSMFDFIINGDPDTKGFKWFIAERGPAPRDKCILTIDMLWDFFTGKTQVDLSDDVRVILDSLSGLKPGSLTPDDERVFKAVALLEAISRRVSGVEILCPTPENVDMAFCGVWPKMKAANIADSLCSRGLMFRRMGTDEYTVARTSTDTGAISDIISDIKETLNTNEVIEKAELLKTSSPSSIPALKLPASISERFVVEGTGAANFVKKSNALKPVPNKFRMLAAFALDDVEASKVEEELLKASAKCAEDFIYVESLAPMGNDLLNQYINNMAYSQYYTQKDKSQARGYDQRARKALKEWSDKVAGGAFKLYTFKNKNGKRIRNLIELQEELLAIDREKYPCGLEHFKLTDTMFKRSKTPTGAECGINQELKSEFRPSNVNRMDKVFEGAWKVENYWNDPAKQHLPIVRIKRRVEELIDEGFKCEKSEVSFLSILEELEEPPYGLMPNNVTALVLGFTLKEYSSNNYFWTNHANTEEMTPGKMKDAIKRAIDKAAAPGSKYKDEYIRKMSEAQRNFLNFTASVFKTKFDSVEKARDVLRAKIGKWSFPLWCVKLVLDEEPQLNSSKDDISRLIEKYCDLLNTDNSKSNRQEIGIAEEIGTLVKSAPSLQDDLAKLLLPLDNPDNCRKGMKAYVTSYRDGKLITLAGNIGDGGEYLNAISTRFTSDSNWLWRQDTVDSKIDDVILDYEIIEESNKSLLPKCTSISSVESAWGRRLDNVSMPYNVIGENFAGGSLKGLLKQFRSLKLSGRIMDRKAFFKELSSHRAEFDDLYNNQLPVFKKACDFLLTDMDEDDISKLMSKLSPGQFTKVDSEYFKYLEDTIKEFKSESKKAQLKKLWSDKTETKDPVAWSERYTTPLLCLFEDNELNYAKHMIALLLSPNSADKEMDEALKYFNETFPWDRLSNQEICDRCFMERIVGDYSVVLPNVDEVRKSLKENVRVRVYDWIDDRSVKDCLKKLATKAYKIDGINKVRSVINNMDESQLREYMSELISNNLTVGIEILKNK